MHSKILLTMALVIAAVPAYADWNGKGEAGLVVSTGNTETQTANIKLAANRESGNWKNGFGASAVYAADSVDTTAQRWEVFTQQDYSFSPKNFWFGAARYEDDDFSGFKYQATISTGLGHKFVETRSTKFVVTAGVGYKVFETRDSFDEAGVLIQPSERKEDVVFRGTMDYEHQFTDTAKVLDKFVVESGADNTFYQNDLSVEVRIIGALALAVGYSVRHNTDPPVGFKNTDTLTTMNLVYEVK